MNGLGKSALTRRLKESRQGNRQKGLEREFYSRLSKRIGVKIGIMNGHG